MPQPVMFNRTRMIERLRATPMWDVLIIGGGATGLGTALDAATRGLSTLLLEQHDFSKGTSSRSTKLIHGGVRYLAQGNIGLVYSALRERNTILRNAPHLVKRQSFIIPCYSYGHLLKYGTGLKVYDLLAGSFSFGRSRFLSRKKVIGLLPNVQESGLKGGVEYYDGQFDDARLAVNIGQTAVEHTAVLLNYFRVSGILKDSGAISGVKAEDVETGEQYEVRAKSVINATGVFVDDILRMDEPTAKNIVTPSRGAHLVISRKFMNSSSALMIPATSDGRVLFAVPWHQHIIVGTTDTQTPESSIEPHVQESDVKFILDNVGKYLAVPPSEKDILSVFAGLRPLATASANTSTKELPRDHKLVVNASGLITITGGKWTTYRKMAKETVDTAVKVASLKALESPTTRVRIHGFKNPVNDRLSIYGSDADEIRKLMEVDNELKGSLVNGHPYTKAEVVWALRNEMARTVEDVLARRLRLLFLDAEAALKAAPVVAALIASELHVGREKIQKQLDDFADIAAQYILKT